MRYLLYCFEVTEGNATAVHPCLGPFTRYRIRFAPRVGVAFGVYVCQLFFLCVRYSSPSTYLLCNLLKLPQARAHRALKERSRRRRAVPRALRRPLRRCPSADARRRRRRRRFLIAMDLRFLHYGCVILGDCGSFLVHTKNT